MSNPGRRKNLRALDIQIMRALNKHEGNISYVQEALKLADPGSNLACCWGKLSRNTIWNCINALSEDGLVACVGMREGKKDRGIYSLTEIGRKTLEVYEISLRTEYLIVSTPA